MKLFLCESKMKSLEAISILILIVIVTVERTESTCGQRIIADKLVADGLKSIEGHWPWHAAISHVQVNGLDIAYKCGGTIITSNAILTAAHCVHESDHKIITERIRVDLGRHTLIDYSHVQQFLVYKVYSHPDYNTMDLKNDIAIIKLTTEAIFDAYVQPICLSSKSELSEIVGKHGTVVGWGYTEKVQISTVLQQADIPVVSSTTCSGASPAYFQRYLTEKTFCAGYLNGTTLCNGDSGGGLVFQEDRVYRIRGIVSLTEAASASTCNSGSYVVFTDVVHYLDWIEGILPEIQYSTMQSDNENWPVKDDENWPVKDDENWPVKDDENWAYVKIDCKFGWNEDAQRYECVGSMLHSTTDNIKISTVEGTFNDGKTYSDVNTVILNSASTTYVPDMSTLKSIFENFDRLFISNSRLKFVERRKLRKLPQLRILNFYGNDIESFDEDILYDLPKLEIFAFVKNKISVLPEKLLANQPKLKELWAYENQIEIIPRNFFANNKELTHLWLSTNALKKIDANFNQLPQLAVLDLRENDCIREQACKQCLYSVREVQRLVDINCNGKAIGKCEKIVKCNWIDEGNGLKCKVDVHLSPSDENCILTLNESPNANVKSFIILQGTMNFLPDFTNVFETFNKLDELDLGFSHIQIVERKKLFAAKKISWLSLYGNEISQLAPDTFDDLKQLKKLLLADNRLTYIHPKIFGELRELTQIWLQKNQLEVLPADIFRNNVKLKEVFAGENKLKTIAIDFIRLRNLRQFDLTGNDCINESCKISNFCNTNSREKMQEKIWGKCPKP